MPGPRAPRDLSNRMAGQRAGRRLSGHNDGYVRETFTHPRDEARQMARAFFDRFPKQAYMSEVETWRELTSGEIEFTMRRLRTAD